MYAYDWKTKEEGSKRKTLFTIYWEISMVLMECYQGKKVVSVEVFIMVTPDSEWIRSWQGYIT